MQVKSVNLRQFVGVCLGLSRRTAELIHEVHLGGDLGGKLKGENDPVTQADFKSQYILEKGLLGIWPGLSIVGEEVQDQLIATDFDFSSINPNVNFSELAFLDKEYPLADLSVYLDPLDGTSSYVKGNIGAVTTLIGVSYKQIPLLGVINHIWAGPALEFQPKTYIGMIGHDKIVSIHNDGINKYRMADIYDSIQQKPADHKSWKMAASVTHYDPDVENLFALMGNVDRISVSGMGNKCIEMVTQKIDGFISNLSGSGRWDILPVDAIIHSFGGRLSGVRGTEYTYDGTRANSLNMDGVFVLNHAAAHKALIPKFRCHYEKLGNLDGQLVKSSK